MYLSQREEMILNQLLHSNAEIPISSLENLLQVSRRTIYRELTNLESSLKPFNIQVKNERNRGYKLVGREDSINFLVQEHQARNQYIFSKEERQDGIVITLLVVDKPISAEELSEKFDVSLNTIYQDLDIIEENFSNIRLNRIQAHGFTIDVSEINNRNIVSANICNNLSETDFLSYLPALYYEEEKMAKPFFLTFITDKSLKNVLNGFILYDLMSDEDMNDNQVIPVLIQLAYSIDRINTGHALDDFISVGSGVPSETLNLSYKIMGYISEQLKLNIPINERNLLVDQLEGVNFKNKESIFNVNFDTQLSYQVQKLIRRVSEKTGNDFRKDKQLYEGLLSHIRAALKRIENEPVTSYKNASLEPVVTQYRDLFNQVIDSFKEVFTSPISRDEEAYILMHFAASYEARPSLNYQPKILIIVSNYAGTGKIIKERLDNQFQSIFQVDITQLSKMDKLNFGNYSLILSTSTLKNFPVEYHLISPILGEKDIKILDDFLQKYRKNQKYQLTNQFSNDNYKLTFNEMYGSINLANEILNQFEVVDFKAENNVENTIKAIIKSIPQEVIGNNSVSEAIIQRYETTPIGIPKTNMSLFHSVHKDVKKPLFKVYNLSKKFSVTGMDREPIELNRILLLLAPGPLDPRVQTVLGWISQSIIENNINTDLYNKGEEETIKNLLSRIFVEAIQESGKGDY